MYGDGTMSSHGYSVYKEAQANELDQAQLILMMYRGAVNFLDKAIETGKIDKVQMNYFVSKAKRVIIELMMSLNIEESGPMGEMLFGMYQRLFKKLNTAHMRDDLKRIAEVRDSLDELEETWRRVFSSEAYHEFKHDKEQFRHKYALR